MAQWLTHPDRPKEKMNISLCSRLDVERLPGSNILRITFYHNGSRNVTCDWYLEGDGADKIELKLMLYGVIEDDG